MLNLLNLATLLQTEEDPGQRALLTKLSKEASKNTDADKLFGAVKVKYEWTNKELRGRWYAKGPSLQALKKEYRMIISAPAWDFDLKNAHPVLLRNLSRTFEVACPVLDDYVANRDTWLRDGATKGEVLATIYGSQAHTDNGKVKALRDEMKVIAEAITPRFSDLKKAVEKHKPGANADALDRSLMSFILQGEETTIMSRVLSLMAKEYPDLPIQSYIFDGFMVRKVDGHDPDDILAKINSWVVSKNVEFTLKPFECPAAFTPLPTPVFKADENDLQAFEAVCFHYPHYLKLNGSIRMVYDERCGLWREDEPGVFYALVNKALPNTAYGTSVHHMKSMWELMRMLPDSTGFFIEAREKAVGKLLFQNGIYDKLAETRMDFTPSVYFRCSVPHPMPETAPANVDEVEKFHFTDPYPEEGVWLKQQMMRAIFGLGFDTALFEEGPGANGKSQRAAAYQKAFGSILVHTIKGGDIAVALQTNPGAASPHLMPFKDARIVYCMDPPRNIKLDMAFIKQITGGDAISCRGLNRPVETFRTRARLHFLVNAVPEFSECEGASLNRRIRHLNSKRIYTEDPSLVDVDADVFLANKELSNRVIHSAQTLIWLMIKEKVQDVEMPASVAHASRELVQDRDVLKNAFDRHFEAHAGAKELSSHIAETLGITPRLLAGRMQAWGFGKAKPMRFPGEQGTRNGYEGVGRKRAREAVQEGGGGQAPAGGDGRGPAAGAGQGPAGDGQGPEGAEQAPPPASPPREPSSEPARAGGEEPSME